MARMVPDAITQSRDTINSWPSLLLLSKNENIDMNTNFIEVLLSEWTNKGSDGT
jgi:hypothetical protein